MGHSSSSALLVAAVLMGVLSSSRTARATGDLRPLLYLYWGVNGGFAAYDVASAALREKNDYVLGGQLAVASLETVPISIWGYRSYEPGLFAVGWYRAEPAPHRGERHLGALPVPRESPATRWVDTGSRGDSRGLFARPEK